MTSTIDHPFKFKRGEKVLCFMGSLLYEARCRGSRKNENDNSNVYYIHYHGWNIAWDEWVPETRVLKYNDDNVSRQNELVRIYDAIQPFFAAKRSFA